MVDDKKPKIPPLPPQRPLPPRLPQSGQPPLKPPLPASAHRQPAQAPKQAAPAFKTPLQPAAKNAPVGMPLLSSEVDEARKQMEAQILALQAQLQEEKEKLLVQTVRAKEEEAMSAKVEESLKDIQDRLRREKREQELQETLSKYELQIRDLEQRLAAERQTWVEALKSQVSQRESQDRELEREFDLKLKDLERRWHEEKLGWSQALRNKEEDIARLKRDAEAAIASEKNGSEKRITQLEAERDALRMELKDTADLRGQEREMNASKLEARDKEFLSLKAQQAMVVTQLRQEKEKEDQFRALLEKMRVEKNALASQLELKDKEYFMLKTQFALYQTRAKTEQEKILKELQLFREQAQKDREHWELNFRAKENEMKIVADNARDREAALKQALEKKELEYSASAREAEEKIRARENEARMLLEKKDAEIKAAAQENAERLFAIERSFEQRLSQKDDDNRSQQQQLNEKIQAKEREAGLTAERERELRSQMAQIEQKAAQMEEKIRLDAGIAASERERFAQKENEYRNALAVEQEKLNNTSKELSATQARIQAMNIEIARKEDEAAQARAGAERAAQEAARLQRENDAIGRERAEAVSRAQHMETELAKKEQEAAQRQIEIEHSANALGTVTRENAQKSADLAVMAEKSRAFEQKIAELSASLSAAEQSRKDAADRLAQAEAGVNIRIDTAKEEMKNMLYARDQELRDAKNEKEAARAEIMRVQMDQMSKENEISRLRSELLAKERETRYEVERREAVFAGDKRALAEKIKLLEEALCDAQNNSNIDAQRIERVWKEKEEVYIAEKKVKDETIASLREENSALKGDRERLAASKVQADDINQAELMSMQRKLWENKEIYDEKLKQKDAEINELKDYQNAVEERVKRELHAKYAARIEDLEKENQALATDVSVEVKDLRGSLQAELKKKEEQQNAERIGWELRLKGRDETIAALTKRIESLAEMQRGLDSKQAVSEFKKTLSAQLPEGQFSAGDKTPAVGVGAGVFERTAVIEPVAAAQLTHEAAAYAEPESKKSLIALIIRIWRSINEPVIVIGAGKNEARKE